jgi:TM2 domain-containing membrane protein YozV
MPGQMSGGMLPQQQGGKSGFVTMMLAIAPAIFGVFGMHRLYTGYVGIGIAQFFTLGGLGVWQLIDIISIVRRKYTDSQGRQLLRDHPVRRLM